MTTTSTTHLPETTSGTITSWLPLTTDVPLQAGCSSAIQWRSGFPHAVAFDPGYGVSVDPFATCQPSQVTSWWATDRSSLTALGITTRFSIGPLACPSAYTTASTSVLGPSSTQVLCCPSSYDFVESRPAGIIGQCNSVLTTGQVFTYLNNRLSTTSTTLSTEDFVIGVPINGYVFTADETPTTSPSSELSINSPPALGVGDAGSVTRTGSSLSGGAIAGIVIGSLAGIAVIAGLLIFIFLKKRRNRGVAANAAHHQTARAEEKVDPYLSSTATTGSGLSPAPQSQRLSEMDSSRRVSELSGGTHATELPDNQRTASRVVG